MENIIDSIKEDITNLKEIKLADISDNLKEDTALIVVDMINGFYNEGSLASNRVYNIIPQVTKLIDNMKYCKKVVFVDSHTKDSTEFKSYPMHCIDGSSEADIIKEVKESLVKTLNYDIIKKNSINGFHAKDFKLWLDKNHDIKNFIVTGVCTDICVETFCISLITYFNENNIDKNIIVPKDSVETYSLGNHDGDLMNVLSLFKMKSNGINVVKSIK